MPDTAHKIRFGDATYDADLGDIQPLRPSDDVRDDPAALRLRFEEDGYLYIPRLLRAGSRPRSAPGDPRVHGRPGGARTRVAAARRCDGAVRQVRADDGQAAHHPRPRGALGARVAPAFRVLPRPDGNAGQDLRLQVAAGGGQRTVHRGPPGRGVHGPRVQAGHDRVGALRRHPRRAGHAGDLRRVAPARRLRQTPRNLRPGRRGQRPAFGLVLQRPALDHPRLRRTMAHQRHRRRRPDHLRAVDDARLHDPTRPIAGGSPATCAISPPTSPPTSDGSASRRGATTGSTT